MQDQSKNNKIVCEVESCIYHDKNLNCTAQQIKVGPTGADCCSETACETYKHE